MFKKEIIILSGGSKKGVCKLTGASTSSKLKGECSLDFTPKAATLYINGDEVSEIALSGRVTKFEVPEYDSPSVTCAVYLGSNLILSGTSGTSVDKRSAVTAIENFRGKKRERSNTDKTENSPLDIKEPLPKSVENNHKSVDRHSDTDSAEAAAPNVSDKKGKQTDGFEENEPKNVETEMKSYEPPAERYYGGEKGFTPRSFTLDDGVRYDGSNFYQAVKPQLDEMFICYPFEERLNAAVPNSKWVKVDAEDGYYVVGVLFSDSSPTFICYGIPGEYSVKPPSDMADMCVWLPLNAANEYGDGYWVIYQSAKDGKIVK